MSLATDLELPPNPDPEPCTFARFILNSPDKEKLEVAIEKIRTQRAESPHAYHGYTSAWLAQLLIKNGFPQYSKDQIQRHVRLDCACKRLNDES